MIHVHFSHSQIEIMWGCLQNALEVLYSGNETKSWYHSQLPSWKTYVRFSSDWGGKKEIDEDSWIWQELKWSDGWCNLKPSNLKGKTSWGNILGIRRTFAWKFKHVITKLNKQKNEDKDQHFYAKGCQEHFALIEVVTN